MLPSQEYCLMSQIFFLDCAYNSPQILNQWEKRTQSNISIFHYSGPFWSQTKNYLIPSARPIILACALVQVRCDLYIMIQLYDIECSSSPPVPVPRIAVSFSVNLKTEYGNIQTGNVITSSISGLPIKKLLRSLKPVENFFKNNI